MNTKHFLLLALAGSTLFAACKSSSSGAALTGSWQGTSMRNEAMEQMVVSQRALLDTLGKNTKPADWPALYGTSNLDSFKKAGYQSLEALQKHLAEAATKTNFTFRPDSIAILRFEEATDSARWAVEGDSLLVLSTAAGNAAGGPMKMALQTLTKDSLTLRFTEQGATSRMHFRRLTEK